MSFKIAKIFKGPNLKQSHHNLSKSNFCIVLGYFKVLKNKLSTTQKLFSQNTHQSNMVHCQLICNSLKSQISKIYRTNDYSTVIFRINKNVFSLLKINKIINHLIIQSFIQMVKIPKLYLEILSNINLKLVLMYNLLNVLLL